MQRDEGEGARGRENRASKGRVVGGAGVAKSEWNVSSGLDQRCEGTAGIKWERQTGMDPIVAGAGGPGMPFSECWALLCRQWEPLKSFELNWGEIGENRV